MCKGNFELVLLLDQLQLLPRQIWALQLHHQEKQLILKPVHGHCEVDDRGLRLHLWWVVRVGQLRLHKKLERVPQDDLLVAKLHNALVAPLDGVARDYGGQHRIDRLAHVLDEHRLALVQGHLEGVQHLCVPHPRDLETVLRLLVLDPNNALQLRVDYQTPPLRVCHDSAVLAGDQVGGKALAGPSCDLRVRGKHGQGVRLGTKGNILFRQEADKLLATCLAVGSCEDADVGGKGAGHENVAGDVHELLPSSLHRLLPDHAIGAQCVHKTLCHVQLVLAFLGLSQLCVFLLDGRMELFHELRELLLQVRHECLDLRQLGVRVVQRLRGLPERIPLGLHLDDDIVVHYNVDDEHAESSCGA
mmetsp:Transcript_33611/g.105295  ORF Transcript_33611/g.105295 Transcript_33611/m.105295 type:complete len:360 (-) Transcript_33611:83-1162(-)